jgi:copper(I)-binding protein
MKRITLPGILTLSLLCASSLMPAPYAQAQAPGAKAQGGQALRVLDAWARATVAGQSTGAAFLQIENSGNVADTLLRAGSSSAQSVELHSMSMDHDVMRMRQLDSLAVPAAGKLVMKAGNGPHLMLLGLKQPLLAGQSIKLQLEFAKAGKIDVMAKVMPITAGH